MAEVIEGTCFAKGLKFGIVASRFNELVTKVMLEGALNELRRLGALDVDLHVVWVPGAYEIPLACKNLCQTDQLNALIAIGCIIRGETSHYEHIAQSVSNELQKVALACNMPVGFGVLTVENMAQAMDRAGGKFGNKGRDAAKSAVEMAQLIRTLRNRHEKEVQLRQLIGQEFKDR